jgi:hypothetical protein
MTKLPEEAGYDSPKHDLVMHEWRLGKQIQIKHCTGKWEDIDNPLFDSRSEYRVKPT